MCISAPECGIAETGIEQLISQLKQTNAPQERIQAARKLANRNTDPATLKAVSLLKSGLKDPNDDVRYESVAALVFILREHNKECPVELLDLADDQSPRIKTNFADLLDFFETYPPGALAVCLKYYRQLSDDDKPNALSLIAKAGGKDKRVMQILFNAVNSWNAHMRVNGTSALWAATQDFEFVLPLMLERMDDFDEVATLSGSRGRPAREPASHSSVV